MVRICKITMLVLETTFVALVLFDYDVRGVPERDYSFNQKLYDIVIERAESLFHNPQFIGLYEIVSFRTRDKRILLNLTCTFLEDLEETSIRANLKAFQLLSNEYRSTNIDVTIDPCKLTKMNNAVAMVMKTTNGNFSDCPIRKGTYKMYNFAPDARKFPPLIPEGSYKVQVQFGLKNGTRLHGFAIYGRVIYFINKH